MKKSESLAISAGGAVLAIVSIAGGIFFYNQRVALNQQIDAYNQSTEAMRSQLAKVEKTENEILLKQNNNPSTTAEAADSAKTRDYVDSFIKQLYHIDYHMSQAEIDAREKNLLRYTSQEILAPTGLFGSTIVEQDIEQKVEFSKAKTDIYLKPEQNSQVNGLVDVSYSIDSLMQQDKEKHVICYSFTFDLNTKKFTRFSKVAMLK